MRTSINVDNTDKPPLRKITTRYNVEKGSGVSHCGVIIEL